MLHADRHLNLGLVCADRDLDPSAVCISEPEWCVQIERERNKTLVSSRGVGRLVAGVLVALWFLKLGGVSRLSESPTSYARRERGLVWQLTAMDPTL